MSRTNHGSIRAIEFSGGQMYQNLAKLTIIGIALSFTTVIAAQLPANQWEPEIKKFEESDRVNPPPKGAVLFIGSSSIRLWSTLAEDFPDTKVINRGFGGSELTDSTLYIDRIVVPYQPTTIVLYAGDNDLAGGKTPEQVFGNYKAFVSEIQRKLPKTKIAFVSIKPSPARATLMPKMKAANEMIKAYASGNKQLLYIDVFTPMLDNDGSPRPELFGPDKLHMNRDGYTLWKSVIAPYLN
jgi:lysophospholipase L1-like esterase